MKQPGTWWGFLRPQGVDLAFATSLTVLGLAGFHNAFGGWSFMVAGVGGAVVGAVLAAVIVRFELPALFAIALSILVFVVLGAPLAVRDEALGGVLPSLDAVGALVDGVIRGWKRILTSTTPTGGPDHVFAVPYLCGFLGAQLGGLLAMRTKLLSVCLLPAAAVLALSILFGSPTPFSLVVQGAVFTAGAVGWLVVRKGRERRAMLQSVGIKRGLGALVMLGVMAGVGLFVSNQWSLAEASERYVLRNEIEPPFDVRSLGSPLVAFRRYKVGDLSEKELFTVSGLPDEETVRLRVATMDEYDGVVFRVSPDGGTRSGQFIRVGDSVPTDVEGTAGRLSFEVLDELAGPWVPTLGTVTSVRWGGDRADALRDAFRLSDVTSTGVSTTRLTAGDTYTVDYVMPVAPAASVLSSLPADPRYSFPASELPPGLQAALTASTRGTSSPAQQAAAVEEWFRNGYYASGSEEPNQANPPGHSFARLDVFTIDELPVGNEEQYAASAALVLRAAGVPARVVMGFTVTPVNGVATVRGADVDAWVEYKLDGAEWIAIQPTDPTRTKTETETETPPPPVFESTESPPPLPSPPPRENVITQSQDDTSREEQDDAVEEAGGFRLPVALILKVATPVLVLVVLPISLILLLKARRRRRRRNGGHPWTRVAGGWAEYLDSARDAGLAVPTRGTRKEAALLLAAPDAVALATVADRANFDLPAPSDAEVAAYWADVETARRHLYESLSWWGRVRARLSLTSLRRN